VDFVLPLKQLAERLTELIRTKDHVAEVHKTADEEENLRRILAHLRVRTGHDFSHYKRSTVMRRLLRRMQVTRKEEFEDYFSYLRDNVEEAQALLADLLISVTAFFRDPKAFESLAANAIPHLFRGEERSPVRVWVAGCATGEEAYSIAMLLMEEAAKHEFRPDIQVFGSDMDSRALNIAREGRYPAAIEADVNEERLRRFFTRDGEFYRVKRDLRDAVLFANHSLLKDPPFSRLDLISCRNLLIYLDRDLQQQVLATLHYGLMPDGYLFLGSSESGEHPEGLFRVVDRDARIYQSAGRTTERLPALPRILGIPTEHLGAVTAPVPVSARTAQAAHREALEASAPPSALVDQSNRVLHLSENAGRYLQPSAGPLTTDITDLVRQELRFELRSALHRAFEQGETSLSGGISVRFNGHANPVYMQVRPQTGEPPDKDVRRAVIFFLEGRPDQSGRSLPQGDSHSSETVNQLRQELDMAQARLRTMREESEAANEELRAANEELQSINEEYRSTAEELETSKEELQSINEELHVTRRQRQCGPCVPFGSANAWRSRMGTRMEEFPPPGHNCHGRKDGFSAKLLGGRKGGSLATLLLRFPAGRRTGCRYARRRTSRCRAGLSRGLQGRAGNVERAAEAAPRSPPLLFRSAQRQGRHPVRLPVAGSGGLLHRPQGSRLAPHFPAADHHLQLRQTRAGRIHPGSAGHPASAAGFPRPVAPSGRLALQVLTIRQACGSRPLINAPPRLP
jgi:two-component system CheB/CheR fusion protein